MPRVKGSDPGAPGSRLRTMSAVTSSGISMPELVSGCGSAGVRVSSSIRSVICLRIRRLFLRALRLHGVSGGPMIVVRPGDREVTGLDVVCLAQAAHALYKTHG